MKWFVLAASAVLVGALGGCGGGGGGGGGGGSGFPILPIPVTLSLTVTVNGSSTAADSNGRFSVKPGDTITIVPNTGTDWSSSSAPAGSISLRNPDISSGKWSAQITNSTTAASVFTVSAKATLDGQQVKDTVFNVSAGDARNTTYKVFASNGTRQTLALNFDSMSYVMTDEVGPVSDTFAPDLSEAGTYLFKSSRNTATAINTRFRLTDNTVVGAFPFRVAKVPANFAVQPFVASNALVTTQADLDGVYNRLGINLQAATRDSNIRQAQVTGSGTSFLLCAEVGITSIAACPPASLLTYAVSPGATADAWNITNVLNPADTGTFSIARVAGKNVYLSAGTNPTAPNDSVFRIGLVEPSSWPTTALATSGGDTNGSWGKLNYDATTYSTTLARSNATVYGFTANLITPSASIAGLKQFVDSTPANYFGIQDGTLAVAVGARSGPAAGYLQIGLR